MEKHIVFYADLKFKDLSADPLLDCALIDLFLLNYLSRLYNLPSCSLIIDWKSN